MAKAEVKPIVNQVWRSRSVIKLFSKMPNNHRKASGPKIPILSHNSSQPHSKAEVRHRPSG